MKNKLHKMKSKSDQIKCVAECVINLLIAMQSAPNYFTDAETFEECHSDVAKIVLNKIKSGKVKANQYLGFEYVPGTKISPMHLEHLLYFASSDLKLVASELLYLSHKDNPKLTSEVIGDDGIAANEEYNKQNFIHHS